MNTQEPIKVHYTDWRGEVAQRTVIPLGIRYGSTDVYPELQWLLRVHDVDNGTDREYALRDCVFTGVEDAGGLEVLALERPLMGEGQGKPAQEAKLAAEPTVDFPHEFLRKPKGRQLAVLPGRDAAHSYVKRAARGLAEAALRKVASRKVTSAAE